MGLEGIVHQEQVTESAYRSQTHASTLARTQKLVLANEKSVRGYKPNVGTWRGQSCDRKHRVCGGLKGYRPP